MFSLEKFSPFKHFSPIKDFLRRKVVTTNINAKKTSQMRKHEMRVEILECGNDNSRKINSFS